MCNPQINACFFIYFKKGEKSVIKYGNRNERKTTLVLTCTRCIWGRANLACPFFAAVRACLWCNQPHCRAFSRAGGGAGRGAGYYSLQRRKAESGSEMMRQSQFVFRTALVMARGKTGSHCGSARHGARRDASGRWPARYTLLCPPSVCSVSGFPPSSRLAWVIAG